MLAVIGFWLFTHFYDRTQRLLGEKDRLLDEIHHRVKNNLRMIESLLSHRMNKREVDSSTEEELRDILDRIKSFSSLYDKLHRTDSVESVDFRDYVRELCSIFGEQASDNQDLSIETDRQSVELPVEKAIPCGLIINELVANSVKYARPSGERLTVNICFSRNDAFELTVKDNGENFNSKEARDAAGGFDLVRRIAEFDLNGDFDLEDNHRMRATVTFPP